MLLTNPGWHFVICNHVNTATRTLPSTNQSIPAHTQACTRVFPLVCVRTHSSSSQRKEGSTCMFLHHVAIKYMCRGAARVIKCLKSRQEEHELQLTSKTLVSDIEWKTLEILKRCISPSNMCARVLNSKIVQSVSPQICVVDDSQLQPFQVS